MNKFKNVTSIIVNIPRKNIDTDIIIPKQYLKAVTREGFGNFLFDDWRYLEPGKLSDKKERKKNLDFVLNLDEYSNCEIMIVGDNFGCGSSREHAVWALIDFGIKVIISTSFADIFYSNCFKNGLLAIILDEKEIENIKANGKSYSINLEEQLIYNDNLKVKFEIDPRKKQALIEGLDDISETLLLKDKIKNFESKRLKEKPWLF
ncbi:MAG: 3-isopropylmalate dehydratase small subunit [Pseudomonadota bacterium]|nr:3-isopropylmalate dehydratase small subunit [Pseudomonadota bacterium]